MALRQRLEEALQGLWYAPRGLGYALLWPLSVLYRWGAERAAQGIEPQDLGVAVVVIGNLTVGGTGKTPLTLALARALQQRGWHPGLISRGYGGRTGQVIEVRADSDPAEVGDEPVLLAQHSALPVFVGRDRVAAGRSLRASHPEVDLILCDDGLQHRALARTLEIVVVDGARGLGNGALLPAGPLRETPDRLARVDAVVINGGLRQPLPGVPQRVIQMTLEGAPWFALNDPRRTRPLADFAGRRCHALAGIGHPARFFEQLEGLGITVVAHPFADHHAYRREDFMFAEGSTLLMTEKDGIKCRRLGLDLDAWVLPVTARLPHDFPDTLQTLLERRGYEPKTA